jgi:hypothetical protein
MREISDYAFSGYMLPEIPAQGSFMKLQKNILAHKVEISQSRRNPGDVLPAVHTRVRIPDNGWCPGVIPGWTVSAVKNHN